MLKEEEKNIEYLVLQRCWSYKEEIFDKKRNKKTGRMMRNILTHANPEWREQRSRPKESRQDEEKKGCGGFHELGQSDDEMERLSKMVGFLQ